ncbi:MAG TPA: hypothetical protein DGU45_01490 [Planctomycetes bacterium]|nr:hypothetical protein [Planctomycetota bacterium]
MGSLSAPLFELVPQQNASNCSVFVDRESLVLRIVASGECKPCPRSGFGRSQNGAFRLRKTHRDRSPFRQVFCVIRKLACQGKGLTSC